MLRDITSATLHDHYPHYDKYYHKFCFVHVVRVHDHTSSLVCSGGIIGSICNNMVICSICSCLYIVGRS